MQGLHLGVALGDVDGDGWTDVYLARLEGDNALYRNLGNWRFEDITARVSEVAGLGQLVSVTLLLMLLAWWWNSWRKGRRDAQGDPSLSGGEGTVAPQ